MCELLRPIWLDPAASPELCAPMRNKLKACLTSNGFDTWLPIAGPVQLANTLNETRSDSSSSQTAAVTQSRSTPTKMTEPDTGGFQPIDGFPHVQHERLGDPPAAS